MSTTPTSDATSDPEPALADALARLLAHGPVLVALDFDGVCAPLVDDPAASRMLPGTRAQVVRLAAAGCRVALVSGRGLESLAQVADPEPGWLLVGGHGAELGVDASGPHDGTDVLPLLAEDQAALLLEVTAVVEALVAVSPGTAVEHKPTAVVLHTRTAEPETARGATAAVLEGPGARPGVHVKQGKDVVELTVLEADKGTALQGLRERTGVAAVLYAGDDVTDEDAFAVLDPDRGDVGVKVGAGPTAAGYRVAAPQDVTVLLRHLADLAHDAPDRPRQAPRA